MRTIKGHGDPKELKEYRTNSRYILDIQEQQNPHQELNKTKDLGRGPPGLCNRVQYQKYKLDWRLLVLTITVHVQ